MCRCRDGGWKSAESHVDLLFDHIAILATFGHELSVSTRLADATMFDNDDQVGVGDGAEPMRDDKAGTAAHELGQALLNEPLAVGIEVAGRFVQDQ